MESTRRRLLVAAGATAATTLAGCLGGDDGSTGDQTAAGESSTTDPGGSTATDAGGETTTDTAEASWRTVELERVRGGESFTVGGLDGPVVVQSFAVWCPKCERQSLTLASLEDSVTVVSLNTDPNEDAEKVRSHAEENGFDWRFAIAPAEMTSTLVEEFGGSVVNAPSTPVIVACEDGGSEYMSGGQSSVQEIETAASRC